MATILLVEDDLTFSKTLHGFLKKNGHEADVSSSCKSALVQLGKKNYDVLLLDYRLPDGTGLEVLKSARDRNMTCPAIVMTSFNDVRTAVSAMRSGAFDYITKPVNPDEFLLVLNDALSKKANYASNAPAKQSPIKQPAFIEGKSAASQKLLSHIKLVAPTDMSVIIEGESGTGKEYAARSIHNLSKRSKKPFVAIDCGALSNDLAASELFGHEKGAFTGALSEKQGVFEHANGGTLFLDEVGNLSYEVQVKLLRAIQERVIQPVGSNKSVKVDVRILTATNEELITHVADGKFREDLYHRLNEFKINVPPLRDRQGDLELFVEHFMEDANEELSRNVASLSDDVWDAIKSYDWPGNLRELRNVIRRAVLLTTDSIAQKSALPDEMFTQSQHTTASNKSDLKAVREVREKEMILKTLEEAKYNKSKAARLLNIDRKTLYSKMERYGLE
jgi:two-component system response regulator HydG